MKNNNKEINKRYSSNYNVVRNIITNDNICVEENYTIVKQYGLTATDINNDGKTTVVNRSHLKMLLVCLPLKDDSKEMARNIVIKEETKDCNKEISIDGGKAFKPY